MSHSEHFMKLSELQSLPINWLYQMAKSTINIVLRSIDIDPEVSEALKVGNCILHLQLEQLKSNKHLQRQGINVPVMLLLKELTVNFETDNVWYFRTVSLIENDLKNENRLHTLDKCHFLMFMINELIERSKAVLKSSAERLENKQMEKFSKECFEHVRTINRQLYRIVPPRTEKVNLTSIHFQIMGRYQNPMQQFESQVKTT